jgi:hypothetical protein
VLSHALWIGLLHWPAARVVLGTGGCLRGAPDEDGQHLTIPYSSSIERQCLIGDGLAVEVEALGVGRQARLALNGALELAHGEARGQLERQQVVVQLAAGGGDRYGDAWPGGWGVSGSGTGSRRRSHGRLRRMGGRYARVAESSKSRGTE